MLKIPISNLTHGVSVIIPVYNGSRTLETLLFRLSNVFKELSKPYEIIFVNDGSKDNSWEVIQSCAAKNQFTHGINLSRNFGQHNALLCGIREARFDVIITLDDDLQNVPEEIPTLLNYLDQGFDVVYGTPASEKHGLLRNLASQITKLVLKNTMGAKTAGMVSAYRAFRTELRNSFEHYVGAFVSIDVLLTWGTTHFIAIPVRHDARTEGISNYTWPKLLSHAMNMVTGFSVLPLKLASISGFFFAFFGFGVFVNVVLRKLLFGTPVPGFTFLASTIAIFAGAQLVSLGIIGEYLARMHFRIMDKPVFNVKARTLLNSKT